MCVLRQLRDRIRRFGSLTLIAGLESSKLTPKWMGNARPAVDLVSETKRGE
jgi:hypothetical protein